MSVIRTSPASGQPPAAKTDPAASRPSVSDQLVRPVGILGLGTDLPAEVLSNSDLERLVETSDDWIVERTGMRERRRAAPDQATSDLATAAAERALADAGLPAADIELIIVATATPDSPLPATACLVQQRLGAHRAAGFDISIACSGFVNALSTARALIACGTYGNALVIGAEVLTSITDYEDRASCILFGDGAGAVVLHPAAERGVFLDSCAGIDGSGGDLIHIPAGGSRRPASAETVAGREHFMRLDGRRVFKFAAQKIPESVTTLLSRNGYSIDDLDLLVPHQANLRIIEAAAQRLALPMDRVVVNIERVGNTSSASIPIALEEARSAGRLKPGSLVCLVGFGAGLSWGANLLRW